mmetsp:Transcript_21637/g.52976  ORF Transcript_21637/g.52976 Transcript_21637/m.52976 type:complete len:411 (-) Transcript_21637:308-1540(-)
MLWLSLLPLLGTMATALGSPIPCSEDRTPCPELGIAMDSNYPTIRTLRRSTVGMKGGSGDSNFNQKLKQLGMALVPVRNVTCTTLVDRFLNYLNPTPAPTSRPMFKLRYPTKETKAKSLKKENDATKGWGRENNPSDFPVKESPVKFTIPPTHSPVPSPTPYPSARPTPKPTMPPTPSPTTRPPTPTPTRPPTPNPTASTAAKIVESENPKELRQRNKSNYPPRGSDKTSSETPMRTKPKRSLGRRLRRLVWRMTLLSATSYAVAVAVKRQRGELEGWLLMPDEWKPRVKDIVERMRLKEIVEKMREKMRNRDRKKSPVQDEPEVNVVPDLLLLDKTSVGLALSGVGKDSTEEGAKSSADSPATHMEGTQNLHLNQDYMKALISDEGFRNKPGMAGGSPGTSMKSSEEGR